MDTIEIIFKVACGIGLMLVLGMIYFAPYRLAKRRGHPQAGSILILNLFIGFTGLGWVLAYAWAHSHINTPPAPYTPAPRPENVVPFHQGGQHGR